MLEAKRPTHVPSPAPPLGTPPHDSHSVVLLSGGALRGGGTQQFSALAQALGRPVTPAPGSGGFAIGRSFGLMGETTMQRDAGGVKKGTGR